MADSTIGRLFLSYSREDIESAQALRSHLNPLIFQRRLEVFFDTESIEKGEEWEKKISSQLRRADAFIFLISRHYFNSEYVLTKELPDMVRRYRDEQVKFWPFYLSEYAWDDYEFEGVQLSGIQAIGPFDSQERLIPLNILSASEKESQFIRVYREIKNWINHLEKKQQEEEAKARQEREKAAQELGEKERQEEKEKQESEKKAKELEEKQHLVTLEKRRSEEKEKVKKHREQNEIAPDRKKPQVQIKNSQPLPGKENSQKQDNSVAFKIFRDKLADGSNGPDMMILPAGEFMMGSPDYEKSRSKDEGPQHKVRITTPFALGRYPVTFHEYDAYCHATKQQPPPDQGWGRGNYPVINISWQDAQAYCQWLSTETGNHYRLPSEAEWEYAARAGTITPFWTGETINSDQANYNGKYTYGNRQKGQYREKTTPVDKFTASPWGLHDMHGNVSEWVEDCWHDHYKDAPDDGSAWLKQSGEKCSHRVLRGGSWLGGPDSLRSAYRYRYYHDSRPFNFGFRVVCRPPSSTDH